MEPTVQAAQLTRRITVSRYPGVLLCHFADKELEAQGGSEVLTATAQINGGAGI